MMNKLPSISLSVLLMLVLLAGCSGEKVTAPPEAVPQAGDEGLTAVQGEVVTLDDLRSGLGTGDKVTGPDVAITAFTATPVVFPGNVLTLQATVANLGTAAAKGPFHVWIGALGTNVTFVQVTIDRLAVGESRSGVVHFDVPAEKFARAYPPGIYTLYCTHDFSDNNPVNNYLLADVDLRPAGEPVGNIQITVSPDSLPAPWTLVGPDGVTRQGVGDAFLGMVPVGDYTITWEDFPDYIAPDPETATLTLGQTLTFLGTYVLRPTGTVNVNPDPDFIDAPWTLTISDGSQITGRGDRYLPGVPTGSTTITWGAVSGYTTPPPQTRMLYENQLLSFYGLYLEHDFGKVNVDPNPDELDAPWTLTQSDGSVIIGHGDQFLTEVVAGTLTMTWGDVAGYLTPDPETVVLQTGQVIYFSATYFPDSGEAIGLYFDTEATQTCADAEFLAHVPAYILYTNPVIDTTRGFECGIDLLRAGGRNFNSIMDVSYPLPATDVGVSTPFDGVYNYIVGYSDPLPTTETTVMATLDIFFLDSESVTMIMRAADPSSSVNGMPMIMLEDFSLQDVFIATPEDLLATAGECGGTTSIDGVRNLFK